MNLQLMPSGSKLSRLLMLGWLGLSTACFSVEAAEQGRLRSPQGHGTPLQSGLAPGIDMPRFVKGEASDNAALQNNLNNFERLHISQNRLTAPKSDRDVLIELYNATNGSNWRRRATWRQANWKSNRPISQWYGVTTDRSGRVTRLNLSRNQLTGSIPAALANLKNLKALNLSGNQLTGSIPVALANLNNLKALNLSRNQLTGSIPAALANLKNLYSLDLENNQLTGSIPAALANLKNLKALNLSRNQLTGSIPAALVKGTSKNQATSAAGWPVGMKTPAAARDHGCQQDCPDEKEAIFRGALKLYLYDNDLWYGNNLWYDDDLWEFYQKLSVETILKQRPKAYIRAKEAQAEFEETWGKAFEEAWEN